MSVSTLGMQLRTTAQISKLQSELAERSEEAASGRKADLPSALGPRIGGLIDMRGEFDRIESHLRSIDRFESTADLMQTALGSMRDAVQDVVTSLAPAVSDRSALSAGLPDLARQTLSRLTDLLNTAGGGSFLFSGVSTDVKPMIGLDEGAPSPTDTVTAALVPNPPATIADVATIVGNLDGLFDAPGFQGTFYQGAPNGPGAPRPSIRIDDGTTLDYGVQGDDAAIREIFRGLHMLSTVDPAALPDAVEPPLTAQDTRHSPYWAFMAESFDRIAGGLAELDQVQARLGLQQQAAADTRGQLEARQVILSSRITDLEQVDPFETQVSFATLQSQLEASYQVTARLASLSLANFLR